MGLITFESNAQNIPVGKRKRERETEECRLFVEILLNSKSPLDYHCCLKSRKKFIFIAEKFLYECIAFLSYDACGLLSFFHCRGTPVKRPQNNWLRLLLQSTASLLVVRLRRTRFMRVTWTEATEKTNTNKSKNCSRAPYYTLHKVPSLTIA